MDARSIAVGERGDHEIARTDATHLWADLLDHANELVTDWTKCMGGLAPLIPEVGATDAPQHNPDDRIGGRRNRGIGPVSDLDVVGSEKGCSTHG